MLHKKIPGQYYSGVIGDFGNESKVKNKNLVEHGQESGLCALVLQLQPGHFLEGPLLVRGQFPGVNLVRVLIRGEQELAFDGDKPGPGAAFDLLQVHLFQPIAPEDLEDEDGAGAPVRHVQKVAAHFDTGGILANRRPIARIGQVDLADPGHGVIGRQDEDHGLQFADDIKSVPGFVDGQMSRAATCGSDLDLGLLSPFFVVLEDGIAAEVDDVETTPGAEKAPVGVTLDLPRDLDLTPGPVILVPVDLEGVPVEDDQRARFCVAVAVVGHQQLILIHGQMGRMRAVGGRDPDLGDGLRGGVDPPFGQFSVVEFVDEEYGAAAAVEKAVGAAAQFRVDQLELVAAEFAARLVEVDDDHEVLAVAAD